jgi:hypothetical protein
MATEARRDERFLDAFMSCWEIHKDHEPTELTLTMYKKSMERFSIEQIEAAFWNALNSLKWFPKPVELIDFVTGGPQQIQDQATIEATSVLKSIKRVGAYQSIQFEDCVTNAVIQDGFGGWVKMCEELTSDNEKWFIRDFSAFYQAFVRQGRKLNTHLPGKFEIQIAANGYLFEDDIVLVSSDFRGKQSLIN